MATRKSVLKRPAAQKRPKADSPAPRPVKQEGKPRGQGGLLAALGRFIPFMKPPKRHRESEAVLRKRAMQAERKAEERKKAAKMGLPHRRTAAPVLAQRVPGLRRVREERMSKPPAPAVPHTGFGGFFKHLFVHASTEESASVGAEKKGGFVSGTRSTPVAASMDLDSLLSASKEAPKEMSAGLSPAGKIGGKRDGKGEPAERALPSAEFLEETVPVPASAPAPVARLEAGASTSKGRFVTKKEVANEEIAKKAAEIGRQEAIDAKKEKKARDEAEAARREAEAAKRKAQEPPPEIILPPRPKSHSGGLQDFLGAIKYLGLGKERTAIIQNLATMLNAGLPLVDALRTLQAEARTRPIRKLLQQICDAVENGSPLWRAMEAQHFFSPHAIALIRIGEEAGNLAENMEYLAAQQEKDANLRGKVKMAMIYPSIVMVMMFVVVVGLGWFVLPNLITVLYSLNVPLPFVTRLVIGFTNIFTNYGAVVVPSAVGGLLALMILGKFTPLRVVFQWVFFKVPGMGRLAREATIARFGVILGGLLQAGVPLTDALRSLAEVTPIVSYRKFYTRLLESILIGNSFSKSFSSISGSRKLLPVSVQQLVMTGEKSGSLARILLKIAEIYEKKANDTAQKLPVILEPMILLFIGALVSTIAFAIIVPIYSIVGNVGGR